MLFFHITKYELVHEEYLFLALIGGTNGYPAVRDGSYLNFHIRMGGCSLQAGCGRERSINLIADGIGISVLVGTADGGIGNLKTLAISGDGNLGHYGYVERNSLRRKTYSVQIEEAGGALRFATGTAGTVVVIGTFHLGAFGQQIDGMLATQAFHIRHIDRVSGGGSGCV